MEKCVLLYKSLIASTFLFASPVVDPPEDAQILQNEIVAAINRSMRFSLRARNHMTLGLWRVSSTMMFKRVYSVVCWLMPVRWNELVRPVLIECLEKEQGEERGEVDGWIEGVVDFAKRLEVLKDVLELRLEKGDWDEKREKKEKEVWKKKLKEKIGKLEVEWMLSENLRYNLIEKCAHEVDVKWMSERWRGDSVMELCSGEMGYFGTMIVRNHLQLPGEKRVANCMLCGADGGDNCYHMLVECRERWRCKEGKKKEIDMAGKYRTSMAYPFDLKKEECWTLRCVMKWLWAMRERRRVERRIEG